MVSDMKAIWPVKNLFYILESYIREQMGKKMEGEPIDPGLLENSC